MNAIGVSRYEDGTISDVLSMLQTSERLQHALGLRVKACEERLKILETRVAEALETQGDVSPHLPTACDTRDLTGGGGTTEEKICDFCLILRQCWPCPVCCREWYCSDQCQRLRAHLHGPFCGRQNTVSI
uniref:Uncharacterized protein TCIL3000_10_180 n=1 Tax=Trypanosoma congolense (strain IL3000) TaxID=1068625 RepID=G0UV45_TRYCI|nr:unnamed protein product [Trypanosoma congolense IL3000]